jgi:hypothetical protein
MTDLFHVRNGAYREFGDQIETIIGVQSPLLYQHLTNPVWQSYEAWLICFLADSRETHELLAVLEPNPYSVVAFGGPTDSWLKVVADLLTRRVVYLGGADLALTTQVKEGLEALGFAV